MTPTADIPAGFRAELIALDVDDTLIPWNGSIGERVVDAIERVQDAGVLVVLATGRTPSTTIPIARAAGINDLVVCSNGALLVSVETEKTIESVTFDPRPVLEELVEHLPDAVFAVEDTNGIFHTTRMFPAGALGLSIREVPFEHLLREPVIRLVVRSEQHIDTGFGPIVEKLGYESAIFGVGDVAWMDVAAKGVNKATMLQRVCERRGIDPANTIAIGDFWNDIEMLRWAGLGVAMGSAAEAVKAAANTVTSGVPGDGVADVLDALTLT
ncbi:MAG: HAD family hydrolase [Actinomycetota bacterium]|nr:HAD family hydrolase [Actinomycetota bacterium]